MPALKCRHDCRTLPRMAETSESIDGPDTAEQPAATVRPREREVRSERRMSDLEALMWNVEKDPHLDPTFGSVTILDRPPDLEHLRKRLLHMVDRIPRLHQRVVPSLGRLAPPEWHDDPEFDLDYHLRHVALPAPGSRRQLFDLATRVVRDPLERTRPLWEFTVVEGLEGGRAALLQKMHHTITDGAGGIRMSEQFIDVTRELPPVDAIVIQTEVPPPATNLLDAASDTFGHTWRRTMGVAQRAAAAAVSTIVHPARLPAAGSDLVETARSAVRQLTVTDQAHSPLWADRSLRRRLEVLDIDFDDAHRASKSLGGSLNDLFVTAVAGGAGTYHRRAGTPVESLRMAMPVSTRTDKMAGGNAFVPTRVVIPVDIDDPLDRFEAIHALLNQTKHERVLGVIDQVAGFANLLPTSVLARFTLEQARTIDFTTSNVRAAPFDLYVAGALIEATYPLGPLSNTAFNLTMMSYRGTLNMGIHIDTGAIEQPELLRDCIDDAFSEVIAAAG
jgi:diacylglycerol O-acyltransferase / wax synthase